VREFDASLRRAPNDPEIMIELGGALFRAEGKVSPEALQLFEQAGRLQPEAFLPVFYQAIAASEEERHADAARLWAEVSERLPADDPRQAMAAQMRARALEQPGP
jgi:cytochrome c-type biogenesis protein CcmH